MRAVCVGRPSDWWWLGDEGNRLALALCRVCPQLDGCLSTSVDEHGVIRAGVAYSDTGRVLPVCVCGYPVDDYRGGGLNGCRRCTVRPRCALPPLNLQGYDEAAVLRALGGDPVVLRYPDRVEVVRRAAGWGWSDSRIAACLGVYGRSVQRIRRRHGIAAGVPVGTNEHGVAA